MVAAPARIRVARPRAWLRRSNKCCFTKKSDVNGNGGNVLTQQPPRTRTSWHNDLNDFPPTKLSRAKTSDLQLHFSSTAHYHLNEALRDGQSLTIGKWHRHSVLHLAFRIARVPKSKAQGMRVEMIVTGDPSWRHSFLARARKTFPLF